MKLLSRADVVIALGSRLGPFGTLPQHGMDYWPKDAKIIQIDADQMLGLVKKISVGICGDAKAAAVALAQRLEGRTLACDARAATRRSDRDREGRVGEGTRRLDARARRLQPRHDRGAEAREPFSGGQYPSAQVLRELEKAMPEDVMVSTDIGNINSVANSYLRFNKPRSFFAAMSWATAAMRSRRSSARRSPRRTARPCRMPATARGA